MIYLSYDMGCAGHYVSDGVTLLFVHNILESTEPFKWLLDQIQNGATRIEVPHEIVTESERDESRKRWLEDPKNMELMVWEYLPTKLTWDEYVRLRTMKGHDWTHWFENENDQYFRPLYKALGAFWSSRAWRVWSRLDFVKDAVENPNRVFCKPLPNLPNLSMPWLYRDNKSPRVS